jgi:hypothetical protein
VVILTGFKGPRTGSSGFCINGVKSLDFKLEVLKGQLLPLICDRSRNKERYLIQYFMPVEWH